jgi:hypothetical protein
MPASVLLVNPNRMRPAVAPLALEYLAEALDAAGHHVSVLDLCFEDDPAAAVSRALEGAAYHLIAITVRQLDDCYMVTQRSLLAPLADLVAQIRSLSDAPVVLGGSGVSVAPSGVLRRTGADYAVIGDGEGPLVALADCAAGGRLSTEACMHIHGLAIRQGGGALITPPVWAEFGHKPLPRRWLGNARYFAEGGQAGIETKRGCPRRCIYCVDHHSKGPAVRLRPPTVVADEVTTLLEQGIDCLHTCDAEFNIPAYHARAVCNEFIARGLGGRLRWYAYCVPNPFANDLAELMAQAGCVGVNFGADSGDAGVLLRLGRTHTPEDMLSVAAACRRVGMACMFDLLLGGPGETADSVRTTIDLMRRSQADCVGVSVGVRLYPGPPLARLVGMQGFSAGNPNLRGQVEGNEDMVLPVYYLDAGLGDSIFGLLQELIAGDRRFFFGGPVAEQPDYNYSDNEPLVNAIRAGARGAYWDILRHLGGQDEAT